MPSSPGWFTQPFTRRTGLMVATGLVLAGCNPGNSLALLPPYTPTNYRLGVGDQVRIIVFGEDQLTGEFRVGDQGRIEVPLLGSVIAAGSTPQELGTSIASQLKERNFLRDPSVSVEVVSYRPVFVLGEVAKPGQYPYQPGMTVLTAIAIAGGYTYRAVRNRASIVRTRNGDAVTGKVYPSSFVAPGDVITVFERLF
jgi:polysaccharide export outer membrane protein